ncbi:universal stress protein [Noviherbaspirillum aridicola]|uniref:Universal stress protein A n=1 Tax=Noviherbaspirillum aridicola TaxID=2849687 RepID=A0ABQ4Q0C2_9BURK|nr:universal stress protein [Noviherbaspirillum aridicola]GIZ50533.1 universal stress protein A [Noviherbaspirillum aridicola]
MDYKTILVHVDGSKHLERRMRVAAMLAEDCGAHLVGAAVTGISSVAYADAGSGVPNPNAGMLMDIAARHAKAALARFEALAGQLGIASFESRLVDDEPLEGISVQGRYADLVVLGQDDPGEPLPTVGGKFAEYVSLHCGCPVLIVPHSGAVRAVGDSVLVAWNASAQATRALHAAIPLLRRASVVRVAVLDAANELGAHGEQPGADIALYLARHGIKVEVVERGADGEVGDALLSLAADLGSDMLVMGCYGHSRFGEILLGGVTRTVLASMTLPVFMMH